MAGSLNGQRLLIGIGVVTVAVAFGAQMAAFEYHSGAIDPGYEEFLGAAYTVGYGLLAWATWAWFRWLETSSTWGPGLTRTLRLMAMANLAFASGLVAVTYQWAHREISAPYNGRLGIAIATTYGLQLFGFVLVSVGFWTAGSVLRVDGQGGSDPGAATLDDVTDAGALR